MQYYFFFWYLVDGCYFLGTGVHLLFSACYGNATYFFSSSALGVLLFFLGTGMQLLFFLGTGIRIFFFSLVYGCCRVAVLSRLPFICTKHQLLLFLLYPITCTLIVLSRSYHLFINLIIYMPLRILQFLFSYSPWRDHVSSGYFLYIQYDRSYQLHDP